MNVKGAHCYFDLSRNKSLRRLETTASSMVYVSATPAHFLRTVLSTVTSPLPLEIVVIYKDFDLGFVMVRPQIARSTDKGEDGNILHHQQRFKALREAHTAREFRLVLCAEVADGGTVRSIRSLEHIVKTEKAKGGLNYLRCEPLIVSQLCFPPTRIRNHQEGWRYYRRAVV